MVDAPQGNRKSNDPWKTPRYFFWNVVSKNKYLMAHFCLSTKIMNANWLHFYLFAPNWYQNGPGNHLTIHLMENHQSIHPKENPCKWIAKPQSKDLHSTLGDWPVNNYMDSSPWVIQKKLILKKNKCTFS